VLVVLTRPLTTINAGFEAGRIDQNQIVLAFDPGIAVPESPPVEQVANQRSYRRAHPVLLIEHGAKLISRRRTAGNC